jgi:hypothetical protein
MSLTLLGGKVVHGQADYGKLAPSLPPPTPGEAPSSDARSFWGAMGRGCWAV